MINKEKTAFYQIKINLLLLLLLFAIMEVFLVLAYLNKSNSAQSLNNSRIEFKDAVYDAEKENYENLRKYCCSIVNIEGEIVFSTNEQYNCGEVLNLHSLSTDGREESRFISPLVSNQREIGTLIIWYQKQDPKGPGCVWLLIPLIGLAFVLVLEIRMLCLLKRGVTKPVATMTRQADCILKYEYDTPMDACDKTELGELCSKLELIRYELRRAEENEKKLKQREENLLASISHDLKTPITTISGCAEGIRDGIVKSEEALHNYANIIIAKSQLLTRMIESMIESSSIGMNDYQIHKKYKYLKPYLEEAMRNLEQDMLQHEIRWEIGEVANCLVSIDSDLIYKVIQNIVSNAVKYTKPGGVIKMETVTCGRQNQIMVAISDNGEGIPAQDIPFIFDKFFRSEKARTQNIPGNGLGLSIVKSIVALHGGIVECESIVGKGTTIVFSLPLA